MPNTTPANAKPIRTKIGVVESDKRDKTRTVVVRWTMQHPKYGKYLRKRTVLQVHDPKNESRFGDTVEVKECRPLSKTKRFELVRIVTKGTGVQVMHQE